MDVLHASFPPAARGDARLLILGSLPGAASLAAGRYYAHPRNQFWRLVGAVIGEELEARAYPERLEALAEAGVGLWDVVATGRRRGSLDQHLRLERANDLPALIAALPRLRAIAFNGGMAARIGEKALAPDCALPRIVLPSSSPAFTLAFEEKKRRWLALGEWLRA